MSLHAPAHRPQALRRIQDPETRPFVRFVEQVVTEEMFRRGLATGISEVTPARPPLAWRFWVVFRTIDAYAQYAATFEAMMEEGAAAAQKRRGVQGGAVYVDPASFHSIAGQKDFIGLQYHQELDLRPTLSWTLAPTRVLHTADHLWTRSVLSRVPVLASSGSKLGHRRGPLVLR